MEGVCFYSLNMVMNAFIKLWVNCFNLFRGWGGVMFCLFVCPVKQEALDLLFEVIERVEWLWNCLSLFRGWIGVINYYVCPVKQEALDLLFEFIQRVEWGHKLLRLSCQTLAIHQVLAEYSEFINFITQGRVGDNVVFVLWKRQSFKGAFEVLGHFCCCCCFFTS